MTEIEAKKLMILSSQADVLARLRAQNRISEQEYLQRLNSLREQMGLPPLPEK